MLLLLRRALHASFATAVALSLLAAVPASAQTAQEAPQIAEHRWWDDDDDDDWRDRGDRGRSDRGRDDRDDGDRGDGWSRGRRGRWTDLVGFAANNGQGGGYWALTKDGHVYAYNGAPDLPRKATRREIVGIAGHPSRAGYWLVDRQGLVTAHGAAQYYGRAYLKAAVGIAPHRSGRGYWVAAKSGSVRALGVAGRYGGLRLHRAFVDRIVLREDADGYYLHTTADAWRSFPRAVQRPEPDRPTNPTPDPTPPSTSTPRLTVVYRITVARSIGRNVMRLMGKARRDGVKLGGWGYRSTARQIELRRQHCGRTRYAIYTMPSSQCSPPTARPGTSMHEKGLAIDFYKRGRNGAAISIGGTREFTWLKNNARTFGLYNLPSEPWHWSTNGR